MTPRGRKKLEAEQFNRALELRNYLERHCLKGIPGRLADASTYAINDWLSREWRLGSRHEKREARKA